MLQNRLPQVLEIIPVYSVIVFMLYSWAIIVYLWGLPSWLNFMRAGELIAVLSYVLSATWLESILLLAALLLASLILPTSILRDDFRVRGAAAAICFLALVMLRSFAVTTSWSGRIGPLLFGLALLGAPVLFAWFAAAGGPLRRSVAWLAEQMTVFLYIFMPITLLALSVVLIRNLF